ncbi:MAG TPA: CDP-diacylglycerol--glycerol-3-phosphate 3-phosphatidyltransferase [Halanaerobiales bacterium]|nr:CDP-diacylglycerol--glycerol-3-phosphate 3-phosphatidyltransferase [Halanaerobiales bacterium]
MNLPNKITITRVLLIPVFILVLLLQQTDTKYAPFLALFIFIVAALTDGIDGFLARKQKKVTKFGKILDPVADKLLISAALIAFVFLREISVWPAIIIIGRELAITGLRVMAASEGKVIAASNWGKWKTNLQILAIIVIIIDPDIIQFPFYIPDILLWIAVFVTILSGVKYFQNSDIDFFREEKN